MSLWLVLPPPFLLLLVLVPGMPPQRRGGGGGNGRGRRAIVGRRRQRRGASRRRGRNYDWRAWLLRRSRHRDGRGRDGQRCRPGSRSRSSGGRPARGPPGGVGGRAAELARSSPDGDFRERDRLVYPSVSGGGAARPPRRGKARNPPEGRRGPARRPAQSSATKPAARPPRAGKAAREAADARRPPRQPPLGQHATRQGLLQQRRPRLAVQKASDVV